MKRLRNAVFAAIVSAGLATAAAAPAAATECGTDDKITVAEMTWLSASTLAYVTQRILADGYGCNAELVPGDTVPTATSMLSKNEPDIAPELWVSTAESIWVKMMEKGNVYKANDIFAGGGEEGWWIPDYVAAEYPQVKSVGGSQGQLGDLRGRLQPGQGPSLRLPPRLGLRNHQRQPVQRSGAG